MERARVHGCLNELACRPMVFHADSLDPLDLGRRLSRRLDIQLRRHVETTATRLTH